MYVGNPFNAITNLFAPVIELPPLDLVRFATLVDLRLGVWPGGIISGHPHDLHATSNCSACSESCVALTYIAIQTLRAGRIQQASRHQGSACSVFSRIDNREYIPTWNTPTSQGRCVMKGKTEQRFEQLPKGVFVGISPGCR